jgi:hypothetical protein
MNEELRKWNVKDLRLKALKWFIGWWVVTIPVCGWLLGNDTQLTNSVYTYNDVGRSIYILWTVICIGMIGWSLYAASVCRNETGKMEFNEKYNNFRHEFTGALVFFFIILVIISAAHRFFDSDDKGGGKG